MTSVMLVFSISNCTLTEVIFWHQTGNINLCLSLSNKVSLVKRYLAQVTAMNGKFRKATSGQKLLWQLHTYINLRLRHLYTYICSTECTYINYTTIFNHKYHFCCRIKSIL